MNQILMAAARGARIELRHFNEQVWYRAYSIDVNGGSAAVDGTYRIHPDDEHLRFGPISTKIRHAAEFEPKDVYHTWNSDLVYVLLNQTDHMNLMGASDEHQQLFLLILSEALAEEGL